jgi:predicted outer membrane repeat protein
VGLSNNSFSGTLPDGLLGVCANNTIDLFPQQSFAVGLQLTGNTTPADDADSLAAAFINACVTTVVLTANVTMHRTLSFSRKMVELTSSCPSTATGMCALAAPPLSRHFSLASSYLQLTSVILTNGRASLPGGGSIQADQLSYVVLQNAWLVGNTASGWGGAILSLGAPVNITARSRLSGNEAAVGGAVYFLPSTAPTYPQVLSVEHSELDGNAATSGEGGAVFVQREAQGILAAINSSFLLNTATLSGGAISGESMELTSCTFNENSAGIATNHISGGGGGLFASGSSPQVTITACAFSGNTALSASGGAMLCGGGGWVNLSKTMFLNSTAQSGGAIALHVTRAVLSSIVLKSNSAAPGPETVLTAVARGGALLLENMLYFSMADSDLTGNRATLGGATAIQCTASDCAPTHDFDGTTFTANEALDSGGALASIVVSSSTVASNSTFVHNRANNNGGAVYGDAISVQNSSFIGNAACLGADSVAGQRGGGALYATGASIGYGVNGVGLSVLASLFEANLCEGPNKAVGTGDNYGGAIGADYSENPLQGSAANISGSSFLQNRAIGGGAVFLGSLAVTVADSIFENNAAYGTIGGQQVGVGGAIQLLDPELLDISGCRFSSNIATRQGGALAYLFLSATTQCPAQRASPNMPSIIATTFFNNTATAQGGALYANGCSLLLQDSALLNNTVVGESSQGGGFFADDSSCPHNAADSCNRAPSLTFINTSVAGNTVTMVHPVMKPGASYVVRYAQGFGGGGAIILSGKSTLATGASLALLDGSSVAHNTADAGAGLFLEGDMQVTVTSGSSFMGNIALTYGGGLYMRLEAGTLVSQASFPPALLIDTSSFLENTATAGGGLYLQGSWLAQVNDAVFAGNAAHDDGGAILLTVGNVTVQSTTFRANNANKGAALSSYPGSALNLTAVNFVSNVAYTGGPCVMLNADVQPPGRLSCMRLFIVDNNSTNSYGGAFALTDAMAPFRIPNCSGCNITTWNGQPPPEDMGGSNLIVSAPRTFLLSSDADPMLNPALNPNLKCPAISFQTHMSCANVFSTANLPRVCVSLWDVFNHSVTAWPATVEVAAVRVFPNTSLTASEGITSESRSVVAYSGGLACMGGTTAKLAIMDAIGSIYELRFLLSSVMLPPLHGAAAMLNNSAETSHYGSLAVTISPCRPRETFDNFVCVCSVGTFLDVTLTPPSCRPCPAGYYKPAAGPALCVKNDVGHVSIFRSSFTLQLSWTPWLGYPDPLMAQNLQSAVSAGLPLADSVNVSHALSGVPAVDIVLFSTKDASSTDWTPSIGLRANFTSPDFNHTLAALLQSSFGLQDYAFRVMFDPDMFEMNNTDGQETCANNFQADPASDFCILCPLGFQAKPGQSCLPLPASEGLANIYNVTAQTAIGTSAVLSDVVPGSDVYLGMIDTYASMMGGDPRSRTVDSLTGGYTYTAGHTSLVITDFNMTVSQQSSRRLTSSGNILAVSFVNRPAGNDSASTVTAKLANITTATYAEHASPLPITYSTPIISTVVKTREMTAITCPAAQYMFTNITSGEPAACRDCQPGTVSLGHVDTCTPCAMGQYAAGDGISCLTCPTDSNSNSGCADITCCLCKYGTYPLVNKTTNVFECIGCPNGAVCDSLLFEPGVMPAPLSLAGFWHVPGDRSEFYACEDGRCTAETVEQYKKEMTMMDRNQTWEFYAAQAGLFGDEVVDANCRPGHWNKVCATCFPGWSIVKDFCAPCDPGVAYAAWSPFKLVAAATFALIGGTTVITIFLASPFFPGIFGKFGETDKEVEEKIAAVVPKDNTSLLAFDHARAAEDAARSTLENTTVLARMRAFRRMLCRDMSPSKIRAHLAAFYARAIKALAGLYNTIRNDPRVGKLFRCVSSERVCVHELTPSLSARQITCITFPLVC